MLRDTCVVTEAIARRIRAFLCERVLRTTPKQAEDSAGIALYIHMRKELARGRGKDTSVPLGTAQAYRCAPANGMPTQA